MNRETIMFGCLTNEQTPKWKMEKINMPASNNLFNYRISSKRSSKIISSGASGKFPNAAKGDLMWYPLMIMTTTPCCKLYTKTLKARVSGPSDNLL
jgi:hypothetical protein